MIFVLLLTQNLKKIKFIKTLTSSEPYWTKCKNRGFRGVTFVFKWIEIFLHSQFSNKISTLKVCKSRHGTKSFVEQILKSFSGRNIFVEPSVSRFTNSLSYSVEEPRKLRILISWFWVTRDSKISKTSTNFFSFELPSSWIY